MTLLLFTGITGIQAATTIYVATTSGPYQSTDSGATWTQLTVIAKNPLLPDTVPTVGSIAVDPKNPNIVYFTRADRSGFYRSTDGAKTWTAVVPIGYTFSGAKPGLLVIDPVATNVIYANAFSGSGNLILKSTDGGATFSPTTSVPPGEGGAVTVVSLTIDPSKSGVLYAVGASDVFKSTDFAKTWTQIASYKTTGAAIQRVYVDPKNSQELYAASTAANCGPNFFFCGLVKTSDGGKSWAQLKGLPASEVDSVTFDSSGAIYAGAAVTGLGQAAMKSTDGGKTWNPLYNQFFASEEISLIMNVDPNVTTTVYTLPGNGDRMYKSTDSGASWSFVQFPPACSSYGGGNCTFIVFASDFAVGKTPPAPPPPPVFSASGIVNGASFAQGGLVPGEIATVFGTDLTSGTGINLTSTLPLPSEFLNNQVVINNKAVPLFAVDNVSGQQQINFQVPWEVASGPNATVVIENGGVSSASISVPVLAAQPGIFSYGVEADVFGAILHANFQLADTAHPAKPGETVLIYCTGLGAVSSPSATGAAGNGQHTVTLPSVTIGGLNAHVSFSGLAPGFAGLYQINVEVPTSLTAGNHPVVVTQVGAPSNSVLLPVQ